MRPDLFYQTETKSSRFLILLTKTHYETVVKTASVFERNCLLSQQFEGTLGQIALVTDETGLLVKVYVGVGDVATDAAYTQALAMAATRVPAGSYQVEPSLSPSVLLVWSLAQYRFIRFKATDNLPRTLVVSKHLLPTLLMRACAVFLVRDLINTPTNELGPRELADVVAQLADEQGGVFEQWVGDELLRENFPAIHAVGRAAADAPRLLSLTWGNEKHPRVTLVGKGVCFDSGGLDIKSASGMRLMKKDMGGAAQVIGLAQWLMSQRLPIRLRVLIPAVENAVGSQAYRPGDVLTMRNGLTVEIDNTDAEGRLVLADAMVKACEEQPDLLIDFATLTGAARVAVGTEISALFTNDDQVAEAVSATAKQVGDPVWRMPLYAGYNSLFDSSIADMANSSASSYAGAITAALFLQRFVTNDIPWMHFDVMAWNLTSKPGKPEGGEAMGIMAVGEYLIQRYG
ncbi:leucyl aminopeptidase family protein [bacterium]|nr:leucyl aminopeptidase family protein [bacterium]